MSAIYGVFHKNHAQVTPNDLERMAARMAFWGPDGHGEWVAGAVGLGHFMLHTTPESLQESLPAAHPQVPALLITADAWLDNRAELFVLLGAFNGIVIEPYIAKANRSDLPKRYFQILGISIFIASMICVMGFVFPQPLLWLLGSKYQKLRTEVGWVVAGACLSYVGGVMWSMHSARRWIYWWGTFAYIGIILITQVGCLILMDLSTTLGVIYFSLISTLAVMVIHVANATFGFRYGAKTTTK